MEESQPLERAIKIAGGRIKLAELLGITPQALSLWHGEVPIRRAVQIETVTGGRVTCRELRPDFFGAPTAAA